MRSRRILLALAAVNAVLIAALGFTVVRARASEWHGTLLEPPMVTQPFELVSAGGPVSSSDLRGRWTILFFGYTRCPDACPLTLEKLRRVHHALGDDAEQVQVTLVSVDPAHDTPDRLADYVTRFDPSFLGLTADAPVIEALATAFGIYHAERRQAAGAADPHAGHAMNGVDARTGGHDEPRPAQQAVLDTSGAQHAAHTPADAQSEGPAVAGVRIDHTTHLLVLDRDGRLAMLWGPELTAEQMTSDLRRLLRR